VNSTKLFIDILEDHLYEKLYDKRNDNTSLKYHEEEVRLEELLRNIALERNFKPIEAFKNLFEEENKNKKNSKYKSFYHLKKPKI
jgi:hypothetical protein